MSERPPRDFLMMNIAKTDPRQVLLAKYLRETGKIATQLMGSADAFYYSYASAVDRSISDSVVELAVSESVLALSGQIHRVLNFHRIDRGIVLPNEFLAQCGLAFAAPAVVPQQQSVITLPSVTQKVNLPAPDPVKYSPAPALVAEEEDDSDEVEQVKVPIKIGGLNASQSVADFLNGTNGR